MKRHDNPRPLFLVIVYLSTIFASIISVYLAVSPTESMVIRILSYIVYGIAAILLGYSVYTIIIFAPKIKETITETLKRNKFFYKVMENYGFKTMVFSGFSLAVTLVFAFMNVASAIRYRLIWYISISAYYFVLILFRGGIFFFNLKCEKKYSDNPTECEKHKWKIYLFGGIVLIILEFAMAIAVTQMVLSKRPMQSGEIMTIANAAYTFYKMAMTVYNITKAHRLNDPITQVFRNINFSDACMSMVSLTVLMLSTFGETEDIRYIKPIVGFVACAIVIMLAIFMIVRARRQMKELQGETEK